MTQSLNSGVGPGLGFTITSLCDLEQSYLTSLCLSIPVGNLRVIDNSIYVLADVITYVIHFAWCIQTMLAMIVFLY